MRARLRRTGLWVVGGSVFASAAFAHLSFTLFGELDYAGTMVAAVLIPLVVASLAFGWIASLTLRLEASRADLERLAHQDALTGIANRRAALRRLEAWRCPSGRADRHRQPPRRAPAARGLAMPIRTR